MEGILYTCFFFSKINFRIPWIDCIVVCVSADRVEYVQELLKECRCNKTIVTLGDSARHRSIRNGIRHLASNAKEPDVMVIHDAVRPFVEEQIVKEVASAANEHGVIRPILAFDRNHTRYILSSCG